MQPSALISGAILAMAGWYASRSLPLTPTGRTVVEVATIGLVLGLFATAILR